MVVKYFIFILLLFTSLGTVAQSRLAAEKDAIAFGGFDVTAYFEGNVVEGKASIDLVHEGVTLLFASEASKATFISNPKKYFPEYGGWCAIAMAEGAFVIPDYRYYKIQDGRLLFFRVKAFFNGLTQWNKDPDSNFVKANGNYSKYFK